jgi:hypothetical protein
MVLDRAFILRPDEGERKSGSNVSAQLFKNSLRLNSALLEPLKDREDYLGILIPGWCAMLICLGEKIFFQHHLRRRCCRRYVTLQFLSLMVSSMERKLWSQSVSSRQPRPRVPPTMH